jgi:hypothetical protein
VREAGSSLQMGWVAGESCRGQLEAVTEYPANGSFSFHGAHAAGVHG